MNNVTQIDNCFSNTSAEIICSLTMGIKEIAERINCVPDISTDKSLGLLLGFSLSTVTGKKIHIMSVVSIMKQIPEADIWAEDDDLKSIGWTGMLFETMETLGLNPREICYVPADCIRSGLPDEYLYENDAKNFVSRIFQLRSLRRSESAPDKPEPA